MAEGKDLETPVVANASDRVADNQGTKPEGFVPENYQVGGKEITQFRSTNLPEGFPGTVQISDQKLYNEKGARTKQENEIVEANTAEVNNLFNPKKPEDDDIYGAKQSAYRYLQHHSCLDTMGADQLKQDSDKVKNHTLPDGRNLKDVLDKVLQERRQKGILGGPECQYTS